MNQIVAIQAQIRVREKEERERLKRQQEEFIEKVCIWVGIIAVCGLLVCMIAIAWNVASAMRAFPVAGMGYWSKAWAG